LSTLLTGAESSRKTRTALFGREKKIKKNKNKNIYKVKKKKKLQKLKEMK
jgi:hypothetical protein